MTEKINILFAGDVMLDRCVRILIERNGPAFLTNKIKSLFSGKDVFLVNLEGPITDNKSVSVGTSVGEPGHLKFTFDKKQTKRFLQGDNINLVDIGNNHILNFGRDGLRQTKESLREWNIDCFGNPDRADNYIVKKVKNKKIAFVSYNGFAGPNVTETISVIKKAKKESDILVVYAHWGSEYKLKENERQRIKAHKFMDAGANIVIGSHPHTVQPIEIYKNKAIFYSLGNFIFDQYFSENVKKRLLLDVALNDKKTSFHLIPVYMESDGSLRPMQEEEKNDFLEKLASKSEVANSVKDAIKKGKFDIDF